MKHCASPKKSPSKTRVNRLTAYIGIPVEPELKEEIAVVASSEERNPTDMCRVLLKEALAARRAAK